MKADVVLVGCSEVEEGVDVTLDGLWKLIELDDGVV